MSKWLKLSPYSSSNAEISAKPASGKRAALYTRISTSDQHAKTQLYDLRELAKQRRFEIVHEYTDVISGAKSKRRGLDQLLADARRHRFERVKAGMRRAKLEGRHIGRKALNVDRTAIVRDLLTGLSLTEVAKGHRISRASVVRFVRDAKQQEILAAA